MPALHLWPSLAVTAALLLVTVALAWSVMRSRMASAQARRGGQERSGPRDRTAVDRIEQDLRALDWLFQQGRISGNEYRRERERTLRD